jgi:hypothetical protein
MTEGKAPDYKGNGVAIWKNQTKDGNLYLTVKILDSITVNAFKNEPKPAPTTPKQDI